MAGLRHVHCGSACDRSQGVLHTVHCSRRQPWMEQTDVSQTLAGTGLLAPAANVAEAMGVVDMAVQSVHVTGAGAARQSETSTEASTTPTSAATATQTLAHLQVQSSSLGAPSGSPQELGDSASTGATFIDLTEMD